MNNTEYVKLADSRAKRSPCFVNCIKAFFTGGIICCIGEAFSSLYAYLGLDSETAPLLSSVTLIFLAGLLTGLGIFDKIAKFGGGGALVPITGFSNAVASPAIDSKCEGFVTGVAAKMFSIAGPVIVYGAAASIIYGIVYFLFVM